jgi:hypothetical protein
MNQLLKSGHNCSVFIYKMTTVHMFTKKKWRNKKHVRT